MYSICKTTHPATGIEHSITCNFFNRSEKSLVVAGANMIRVLRLIPDIEPNKKKPKNINIPPKMKMECLATYTLFGNILSMQSVSLAGSQRDALLLSFKDAKLSLVEYDLDTHDLKTLSLHYFEEDEIRGGWTQHMHIPIIRVDPEGRCAVMLVYGRQLVVLPFRRETVLEEGDILTEDTTTVGPQQSRAPVLSSYMILLKDVEEKMDNIVDIQFLHGYYEPTLLILYEPVRTFPGRIAVRRDTCAMVAISLNIQQRVHPVIWSVANLPMDCTQALAVRKPLGGTLVFCINSLIYLNQSVPPYGISLNSITDVSTSFPLKVQENVKMSLEGAQASFISSDRLVLSLKNGELYVLTLQADSMRSVRSFHFEKAAASVLTTCTCIYADNYLFLGSRLGNSLLLKFTEKRSTEGYKPPTIDLTQQPLKKRRMDTLGDWMASDVSDIRDLDELEVYGSETQTSVQLTSYSFEVCDSLLNIGPCGNISMGEPAFLSEEFSNNSDPDIELVTTSGYGKNGALCVLQRSVRPQVVTTFELTGITDMWIVTGRDTMNDDSQEPTHAFLILSQAETSMILQTGQEINEIDNSGFNTQGPTIYSGNLGSNKYIIQVSQMGVRLLQGPEQIQHMPLDLGSPLVHATSVDPYVFLLTEDGQVVGLTLRETKSSARLIAKQDIISSKPLITAMHAYRDVSGMFSSLLPETDLHLDPEQQISHGNVKREVDDEDELLYGEPGATDKAGPQKMAGKAAPWWCKYYVEVKASYWLLVTRENGHLEMYSVPDLLLCYLVAGIGLGHRVLSDSLGAVPTVAQGQSFQPDPADQIRELMVAPLGNMSSRPLLILRTDDQILLYEAYRYPKGHLKMRFRKIPQSILVKLSQEEKKARFKQGGPKVNQLRYFGNIAGYNGVFVCGNQPHWIFLTFRGELRIHPMTIDGGVTCFAPFNNINCPQGFLYFNQKGELRICVLPTHLSYDASWPVRKVPLRCTPHFITYHLESKTYCLVTSIAEPTNEYYKFNGEDKELSVEERDERFPFPVQERFSVLLFSPVSWELIPNTKMELEDWEHVTCLKNVSLAYEGTRSGLKGYIALGTNYNYSEDITSRGRILIFDIIEVVPEPGQPLTKNRFKMLYSKEQKGPVTAMTHALGFLVSAVGQKIYIWQLKDNDLVGVAFIDTQIYIHQILCIKSLILVADVYKSITLLRFQEEYRTLSLVSRDFRACEVYNVEFLIDNAHLGFLVSDREKNIVLYMYQPQARESYGGQRLIRKADFHVGQHINTFFRIRCKVGDGTVERKHQTGAEKRHITMFATLDGALGYLLSVPEKSYRRLLMLQNVLVNQLEHTAGLNPKAFRQYKSWNKLQGNPSRGVIDGELVWMYLSLPAIERQEIAKKIGTKVDEIIDDLGEIEKITCHF